MSGKKLQPLKPINDGNKELNKIANSEKGNKDAAIHYKIDGIGYYHILCCIIRYGLFTEYGISYSDQAFVESNQMMTYSGGGLEIYDETSAQPNKLRDLFSKKNNTGNSNSSKTFQEDDEIYEENQQQNVDIDDDEQQNVDIDYS